MAMERLLLRPTEAAEAIGVSRARMYELMSHGELPGVVRIGRSVRVHADSLREWVKAQAVCEAKVAAR